MSVDELKALGNAAFSAQQHVRATLRYTEALALESSPETRSVLHSNRAAALLQLAEWTLALEDCDAALRLDEGNKKALFRRASANEGCGEVSAAVADLERLLELGPVDRPSVEARLRALQTGANGTSSAGLPSPAPSPSAVEAAFVALPWVSQSSVDAGATRPSDAPTSDAPHRVPSSQEDGPSPAPPLSGPWPQPAPASVPSSELDAAQSIGVIGSQRPKGNVSHEQPSATPLPLPIDAVLGTPALFAAVPPPLHPPLAMPPPAPPHDQSAPRRGREPRGRGRGNGGGVERRTTMNGFSRLAGQALNGIGVAVEPPSADPVVDVKGKGKARAVEPEPARPVVTADVLVQPSQPSGALVPARVRAQKGRRGGAAGTEAGPTHAPSTRARIPSEPAMQLPAPSAAM